MGMIDVPAARSSHMQFVAKLMICCFKSSGPCNKLKKASTRDSSVEDRGMFGAR